MVQQRLIVNLIVNVETVPQITADHYTAEPQCLHILHVVEVHASSSKNLLVNQSFIGSIFQFLMRER